MIVFQAEIPVIVASVKDCQEDKLFIEGKNLYLLTQPDSFADL
jgi:hypothetical protein